MELEKRARKTRIIEGHSLIRRTVGSMSDAPASPSPPPPSGPSEAARRSAANPSNRPALSPSFVGDRGS